MSKRTKKQKQQSKHLKAYLAESKRIDRLTDEANARMAYWAQLVETHGMYHPVTRTHFWVMDIGWGIVDNAYDRKLAYFFKHFPNNIDWDRYLPR